MCADHLLSCCPVKILICHMFGPKLAVSSLTEMLSVWLWLETLSLSLAIGCADDDDEGETAATAALNGDNNDAVGDSGPLSNEAVGE